MPQSIQSLDWLLSRLAKLKALQEKEIRESLEMKLWKRRTNFIDVLVNVWGDIINTNCWKPLFQKINLMT